MATHSGVMTGGHLKGFASNRRMDNWWVGPLLTAMGLMGFVVYSSWAAFQAEYYFVAPYTSPLYSPLLLVQSGQAGGAPMDHALFGAWPSWWPSFLPASPSFLILLLPGLFRFTCYYGRKAYYRSIAGTPPACAVQGFRQKKYRGETALMFFQNFHRYTLYLVLILVLFHYYDAFLALFKDHKFGIGVGTVVLFVDAILLSCYVFGCHSWRHLIGGRLNCFSCDHATKKRYGLWKRVTWLNERHKIFFWASLYWIGFADFYIRMVSMGVFKDLNTWG